MSFPEIAKTAAAALCLALAACAQADAKDFYGKIAAGYGTALRPDITGSGARNGGFTAVFQGLFGEGPLKHGGEFGIVEVYTSWDKERFVADKSVVLLPLLGSLQYGFSGKKTAPYIGLSAGPYFAIENFNNNVPGTVKSTSGSNVYGGGCLSAGLRIKTGTKYDADLSCRYSFIKASENISMLGVYLGVGTKASFFNPLKKWIYRKR